MGERPGFDVLNVGGIELGTEAVVRKRLDAMRQTNAAATRARKERGEIA